MKRCLKLQMQTVLPSVAGIAIFSAGVVALSALFPDASAVGGIARSILRSNPTFIVIFLALVGSGVFDNSFQLALSMGGTRKGLFLSFQVSALLSAAATVLLVSLIQAAAMQLIPDAAPEALMLAVPSMWLLALIAFFLGSLWEGAYRKNKVWGAILVVCSMIFLPLAGFITQLISYNSDTLGDLPWISPLCMAAAAAVLDCILWRSSLRMTVR